MSVLSRNKIYCGSDLIAGYSSWIEYLNEFLRIGWTNGILYILWRLNCNDLSTGGCIIWCIGCLTSCTIEVYLYIYQIFSPFHCGRASLGCKTSWVSCLVSNDLRSKGFSYAGLSFYELIIETWSKIDRIAILTEFIPLWKVAKWLLNWNMITQKFQLWKSDFSSFDRWWTVLFICRMSLCKDLRRSLLVSVSA